MPLTPSTINRQGDAVAGDGILTFVTAGGQHAQGVAIVDAAGAQAGIAGTPLATIDATVAAAIAALGAAGVLDALLIALQAQALGTVGAPVNVTGNVGITGTAAVADTELLGEVRAWGTNDVDEASATVTYVGMERAGGEWVVKKLDTAAGTSIRYATITNNPGAGAYAAAWAARAGLAYGTYGEAF